MYHACISEWSAVLGVSQRAVETEYYIVDIPKIIDSLRRREAGDRLFQLQASSFLYMQKNEKTALIKALQLDAGVVEENTKFDRAKMDQLHAVFAQTGGKA